MNTPVVELNHVHLVYPVYSIRAQSLRNAVVNMAVGGRLLKDNHDVVQVKALSDINLKLYEGSRLGVMGHNGSGKSTLLKVMAGIYEPTHGTVEVHGRISSMIDINLGLDWNLTGRENIVNMGRMRGMTHKQISEKIPEITEFSDLGAFIDLPLKTYSSGMSTRLVFAVATSLSPDILLLDEWIGAGDANFFDKAKERMNDILSRSRVMVLASHSGDLIRSVCDKLLVLDMGQPVYMGDVDEGLEFMMKRSA